MGERIFDLGGNRFFFEGSNGRWYVQRGRSTFIGFVDLECRALCAALIECGFGPEEQTCKWERNPPNRYNDDWTLIAGCNANTVSDHDEFCPYCGKRIEVVR